jgi:hypothetical protein
LGILEALVIFGHVDKVVEDFNIFLWKPRTTVIAPIFWEIWLLQVDCFSMEKIWTVLDLSSV